MMKYSQNNEQEYILNYFGDRIASFLDIGAYDGITFSNTCALLLKGWFGYYLEPSPILYKTINEKLKKFIEGKQAVIKNAALGTINGRVKFYDSGGDAVGTTSMNNVEKWKRNVTFTETEVDQITIDHVPAGPFPMISLDTEGTNIELLRTLPLDTLSTELIVVEHDSQYSAVIEYCGRFGMKEIHRNGENLIMAR